MDHAREVNIISSVLIVLFLDLHVCNRRLRNLCCLLRPAQERAGRHARINYVPKDAQHNDLPYLHRHRLALTAMRAYLGFIRNHHCAVFTFFSAMTAPYLLCCQSFSEHSSSRVLGSQCRKSFLFDFTSIRVYPSEQCIVGSWTSKVDGCD